MKKNFQTLVLKKFHFKFKKPFMDFFLLYNSKVLAIYPEKFLLEVLFLWNDFEDIFGTILSFLKILPRGKQLNSIGSVSVQNYTAVLSLELGHNTNNRTL